MKKMFVCLIVSLLSAMLLPGCCWTKLCKCPKAKECPKVKAECIEGTVWKAYKKAADGKLEKKVSFTIRFKAKGKMLVSVPAAKVPRTVKGIKPAKRQTASAGSWKVDSGKLTVAFAEKLNAPVAMVCQKDGSMTFTYNGAVYTAKKYVPVKKSAVKPAKKTAPKSAVKPAKKTAEKAAAQPAKKDTAK